VHGSVIGDGPSWLIRATGGGVQVAPLAPSSKT
jgi:hypothetical protein